MALSHLDHLMPSMLSFVVCSDDNRRYDSIQAEIRRRIVLTEYEIIRISDAQSMAEGYNRGYRQSRGPWIVFCHDDIGFVSDDVTFRLMNGLSQCDMLGVCGTSRLVSGNWYDAGPPFISGAVVAPSLVDGHYELQLFARREPPLVVNVQALDGIFIAARRDVVDALGGFNEDWDDFVLYDIDFSFRAFLRGFRVGIATDIVLFHNSHVGRFSSEKLHRWTQAQQRFVDVYGQHLSEGMFGAHTPRVFPAVSKEHAFELFRTVASEPWPQG
jgi:glycosyltransferase involved in cell wall biosynthesis